MSKRQKIKLAIAIGASLILVLFLLVVPFRSWTRNTLALALVRVVHGQSAAKVYDKEFAIINNDLASKGFQLIKKAVLYQDFAALHGCIVDGYQGVHETIGCRKQDEYKPKSPEAFKALWLKQAASIEDLLKHNGWYKQNPDQPKLTELFDTTPSNGNWLTYAKDQGKVSCQLEVAYNPPYPNPDDQIWIREWCVREIKFFGGY